MKTDKEVIAGLLDIIRLLIGTQCAPVAERLTALEAWKASAEAIWPNPTPEQEI